MLMSDVIITDAVLIMSSSFTLSLLVIAEVVVDAAAFIAKPHFCAFGENLLSLQNDPKTFTSLNPNRKLSGRISHKIFSVIFLEKI